LLCTIVDLIHHILDLLIRLSKLRVLGMFDIGVLEQRLDIITAQSRGIR
jgi:hypothetical protein